MNVTFEISSEGTDNSIYDVNNHLTNRELDDYITPYARINSRRIKGLIFFLMKPFSKEYRVRYLYILGSISGLSKKSQQL